MNLSLKLNKASDFKSVLDYLVSLKSKYAYEYFNDPKNPCIGDAEQLSRQFVKSADGYYITPQYNTTNAQWLKLISEALNAVGVIFDYEELKVRGCKLQCFTTETSDQFLYTCALKGGGKGLFVGDKEYLLEARKESAEYYAKKAKKAEVLATLTDEQRQALGL